MTNWLIGPYSSCQPTLSETSVAYTLPVFLPKTWEALEWSNAFLQKFSMRACTGSSTFKKVVLNSMTTTKYINFYRIICSTGWRPLA